MRGKKIDHAFVSEFISDCVKTGQPTFEQILNHAKASLSKLDAEIQAAEQKKAYRNKLLDVIHSLEKPKTAHQTEAKLLDFYQMLNHNDCKFVCDLAKKGPLTGLEKSLTDDHRFAVKKLLELNVLERKDGYLLPSKRFQEYVKNVLHGVA